MSPSRREVLAGLGGATIAYALQVGCAPRPEAPAEAAAPTPVRNDHPRGRPNDPGVDAREWLVISADGSVTVFTSRTEIGQGITTILYDLVGQALELPRERISVVLGDTDACPSDGPTTGSAATRYVAWAFWIAAHQIKRDLVLLAAEAMDRPAADLRYRQGMVVDSRAPQYSVGIGDLAEGQVRRVAVDPEADADALPSYVDQGTKNVNAEAIVTGTHKYTADHHPEGCIYGASSTSDYHFNETNLRAAHINDARKLTGVVRVKQVGRHVIALGETYTATQRAIAAIDDRWIRPERSQTFDTEAEIRAGAELKWEVENTGDVEAALGRSERVIAETYRTQFMTQVPIETDTAIASMEDGRLTLRLGTQNPFWVRNKVAAQEEIDESQVRIVASPAGGAFGSKADNIVGEETARMLRLSDGPVKHVYSRLDDIQKLSRYKEAVVFDVTSGLDADGRLLARKIDIFQDEGRGTTEVYTIPNVRTRLYGTKLPMRHATMRGTSYVQTIFGMESHTDMLARAIGVDPVEFRLQHAYLDGFPRLIEHCAASLGYGRSARPAGRGVGFAMCEHGGYQLGVVGAEVDVDPESGRVSVVRLVGAFDIGIVIHGNLATNNIKGSMIWGLGAALLEEVDLDGHSCHTTGFRDYRIARMSDVPPIEVAFFNEFRPGSPRGCGELPLPPTTAAIANAVYDAIDVRFYELPITPERVRTALQSASA